jgi:ELWxxDGT repeat protein
VELWKYDGTTATMVNGPNGINPSGDSFPSYLTVFDGALYFEANDGTNGYELWKYDGTTASMVNEPNGINPSGNSYPTGLTVFDGALYFEADDGTNGDELWKYDGSTLELIDILPGDDSSSSDTAYFSVADDRLYFVATVADKDGDSSNDKTVLSYDSANGLLDMLPAGVSPNTGKNSHWAAIELAENVYFEAEDDAHGSEIWVTDGTIAGTKVIDTIPGPEGLEPNNMTLTSHGIIFTSEQSTSPWIIEFV